MASTIYWLKKRMEMRSFDSAAEELVQTIPHSLHQRIEKFKRYEFDVSGLLLDVGAGVGIDILALSKLGVKAEFVGVDISKKCLTAAKKNLSKTKTTFYPVLADMSSLPFKDKLFDAVNTNNVVRYCPLQTLKKTVEEFSRIMKTNSLLFINEPCTVDQEYALFAELNEFVHALWASAEIMKQTPDHLRISLYNALPIFRFGEFYSTIIQKILMSAGFEVETAQHYLSKSTYPWMLHQAKNIVEQLRLKKEEQMYLCDKMEELQEKFNSIRTFAESWVAIKARKGSN